jgi:hypothetical protein
VALHTRGTTRRRLPIPEKRGEDKRFLGRKRDEIVLWWSVKETKRKEIRMREKRQFSLGWKHHPGLKILSRVVFPPDTTKV